VPPERAVPPNRPPRPLSGGPLSSVLWVWAPLVVLAALPLLILKAFLRPVSDPDAFWHVRAGGYLWSTREFSGPEPWSRFSSRPWVLHEWLPELVMYAGYQVAGLPALAWLTVLGAVTVFAALYASARTQAAALPAAFVALLGWLGSSASLSPRPQVVSLVLLPLTAAVWLRTSRDGRPRWWLVPLTWVWAGSHGMWFIGVLLGLGVSAAMAAERRWRPRQLAGVAAVPVASIVAAAATPPGVHTLTAPLTVRGYTRYVAEWDAPRLQDLYVAAAMSMAALVVLVWARSGRRVPWPEVAVLVMGVGWALLYARTVAVGAALLTPLAAGALHRVLASSRPSWPRREAATLGSSTLAALLIAAFLAPGVAAEPGRVPAGMDQALARIPAGSPVFAEYDLGGWLLLRHPQLEPVVDPRTEVFSTVHLDSYLDARAAKPGWDRTLESWEVRHAVLPTDSPLAEAMRQRLGWDTVASDRGFSLIAEG
jgi:hypothetical protein